MNFNYYILVFNLNRGGLVTTHGPFYTAQARDDFAGGLWFGKPVREAGALRGRRIKFDNQSEWLYYTETSGDRLTNVRNVTAGDLAKASCFPRDKK